MNCKSISLKRQQQQQKQKSWQKQQEKIYKKRVRERESRRRDIKLIFAKDHIICWEGEMWGEGGVALNEWGITKSSV